MSLGRHFTQVAEERAAMRELARQQREAEAAAKPPAPGPDEIMATHYSAAREELVARLQAAQDEGQRKVQIAKADLPEGSPLRTLLGLCRESLIKKIQEEGFSAYPSLRYLGGRRVEDINAEAGGYNQNEYSNAIIVEW